MTTPHTRAIDPDRRAAILNAMLEAGDTRRRRRTRARAGTAVVAVLGCAIIALQFRGHSAATTAPPTPLAPPLAQAGPSGVPALGTSIVRIATDPGIVARTRVADRVPVAHVLADAELLAALGDRAGIGASLGLVRTDATALVMDNHTGAEWQTPSDTGPEPR